MIFIMLSRLNQHKQLKQQSTDYEFLGNRLKQYIQNKLSMQQII